MMTRLREMVTDSDGGHVPEKRMKPDEEVITANIRSQSGAVFSFPDVIMCPVAARHAARTTTRAL